MKTLVVNPPNAPFSSQGILIEPIDVLSVASFIAAQGHAVKMIDMDVKRISGDEIARHVSLVGYDAVIIIYDYHIPLHGDGTLQAVKAIAAAAKAAGCRVAVGGKMATYKPENLLNDESSVDVVLRHEVEPALQALLNLTDWSPANLCNVPAIAFRDAGGTIAQTPLAKRYFDLNQLPIPDRKLVDLPDYIDVRTILSSRGCHMKCDFCHVPGYWGGWRSRDAANVADEIEQLAQDGAEKILFLDDNTTVNRKRMLALCDELIRRRVRPALGCLGSLSLFDREMMERMFEAGFRWIHYGVEAGDDALLEKIHKRINAEAAAKIIKDTRDIGFRVRTSWIIDLPGSTMEQVDKTAAMILATRSEEIRLHHLALRMGSQYFEDFAGVPSTQYIHNGLQNQNLSAVDAGYIRDTIERIVKELEKDGYVTVRNPDEFRDVDALRRKSPGMKVVSLCPLRYGLEWAA